MPVQNNDIIRVVASMLWNLSDILQNTYHFRYNGSADEPDDLVELAVVNKLDAAYSELIAVVGADIQFTDITVWNVTQDRPMQTYSWPTLVAGEGTGQTLPLQAAALVKFRTLTARSQGRKYLGGFVEGASESGGVVLGTTITVINNYADEILVAATTTGGTLTAGNWRYPSGPFSAWVGRLADTRFRTQRRRVINVGI